MESVNTDNPGTKLMKTNTSLATTKDNWNVFTLSACISKCHILITTADAITRSVFFADANAVETRDHDIQWKK